VDQWVTGDLLKANAPAFGRGILCFLLCNKYIEFGGLFLQWLCCLFCGVYDVFGLDKIF
jgi:hypothetical protein